MRHVRSIVYALVLAAAVWVLCGAGFGDGGTGTGVRNYPLLLLAGVVYAILLFVPISPVGPLVAGVAFFAASIWALASPSSYANVWPAGVTWADLSRPGQGLAAVLAVPMFALSARRRQTDESVFGRLARTPPAARPPGPAAAGSETAVPRVSDPDSTAIVIDAEQTQLVRAPEPPAPEPPALIPKLVSEIPAVPARSADETMVIRQPPGIPPRPADETMAIPGPEAVAAADVTQVIPRDLGGDRQVIKPLAPPDAEQTQVVKVPAPLPPAPTAPAQTQAAPGQTATPPAPADPQPTPAATPPAHADTPPATRPAPPGAPPGQSATPSAPADRPPTPAATPSTNAEAPPTPADTPLAQADTPPADTPPANTPPADSAPADSAPTPPATSGSAADTPPTPLDTRPARTDPPPTPSRSAGDAEQTQVIRIVAAEPDRVRPPSIAGSERPDPGADPTSRLRRPAEPGAPSEPPTAAPDEPESAATRRPRSATDLERPADEAADDTRRLRIPTIPAPRRQHEDEAG